MPLLAPRNVNDLHWIVERNRASPPRSAAGRWEVHKENRVQIPVRENDSNPWMVREQLVCSLFFQALSIFNAS